MVLKDKTCFITGASRGIGKAILERFVEEGAGRIYANALHEGRLDDFCSIHPQVTPMYFDVSDSESVIKAMMRVRKESGRLDVLVNNAGIVKDELIGMISRQSIEEVFGVNVFGTIELLQAAARLMMKTGGSIINLSSIVANIGNSGQLVYSATKGAVVSLTKSAAKELGPKGIRVNAIAPNFVDTDMTTSVDAKFLSAAISSIPLGRFGLPVEIADTCVFLASDMSSYVTGHILEVDGGM